MTEQSTDEADNYSAVWRLQKTPLENSVALGRIFFYSSARDLKSFRQVCRQWNEEAGNALAEKADVSLLNSNRFEDFFHYETERRRNGGIFLKFARFHLCIPGWTSGHEHFLTFVNGPWRERVTWLRIDNLEEPGTWNIILHNFCRCFPNLKVLEILAQHYIHGAFHPDKVKQINSQLIPPNVVNETRTCAIASKLQCLRVEGYKIGWKIVDELHAPIKELFMSWSGPEMLAIRDADDDYEIGGKSLKIDNIDSLAHILNIMNRTPEPLKKLVLDCEPPMDILDALLSGINHKLERLKAFIKSPRSSPLYTSSIYAYKIFSMFTTPSFNQLETLHLCIQVDEIFTRTRADCLEGDVPLLFPPIFPNLSLTTLKLSFMNNDKARIYSAFVSQLFKGIPKYFPNLNSLSVDIRHPHLLFESLLSGLKTLTHLEHLQLYFECLPGSEEIPSSYFFGPSIYPTNKDYHGLLDLKGLQSLRLAGWHFRSTDTDNYWSRLNRYRIFDGLAKMESLRHLDLPDSMIRKMTMKDPPFKKLKMKLREGLQSFSFTDVSLCKKCSIKICE